MNEEHARWLNAFYHNIHKHPGCRVETLVGPGKWVKARQRPGRWSNRSKWRITVKGEVVFPVAQ